MDKLNEIPSETLAGGQAQTRLQAFQRDYTDLAGTAADIQQSNDFVAVAKSYGERAAVLVQNPPHSADIWQRAEEQWQEALKALEKVPENSPSYVEAQSLRGQYLDYKSDIEARRRQEEQAVATIQEVRQTIPRLIDQAEAGAVRGVRSQLQQVIQNLETVPNNTTVSAEAQQLYAQATAKLNELNQAAN